MFIRPNIIIKISLHQSVAMNLKLRFSTWPLSISSVFIARVGMFREISLLFIATVGMLREISEKRRNNVSKRFSKKRFEVSANI
jgi:hypothetical protein